MLTRRLPLHLAGALLVALCLAPACGGAPPAPGEGEGSGSREGPRAGGGRPNVVIISVDTLRADRLGAYGSRTAATPSADALAARSVLFHRAYAPLPKTNPSLCSMMTGRYPSAHGVRRNGAHLPETELTLAELLQAAGYGTAAFISNHVMHSRHGLAQGFQIYDENLPDPIPTRDSMERTAVPLVDAVLGWARDREAGGPIFLWVHFIDPHGPYTPPEFTWDGGGAPGAGRTLPVSETNEGAGAIPAYQALPGVSRPDEYIARYDAEVEHMDRELGRLVEGLEAAGVLEGALLIFTADHGESLGGHDLWFQHGTSLYDPQIRIPLLISGPGISPGEREETVGNVDVAPTVLELLGLPVHEGIQGMSLAPALRGGTLPADRILHAELGRTYASLKGSHKLIWDASRGSLELFDTSVDPLEASDLAPAGGPLRAELAAAASRFARENTAEVPVAEDEETLETLRSLGYVD